MLFEPLCDMEQWADGFLAQAFMQLSDALFELLVVHTSSHGQMIKLS